MRRLILLSLLLAMPVWAQTPTPLPQYAQMYNMGHGPPGPTATPTATPAGGTVYSLDDDCDVLTGWTDASSGTASWTDGGTYCLGNMGSNWEEAVLVSDTLTDPDTFCFMLASNVVAGIGSKHGCILRAQGTPGTHYQAAWNQQNGDFAFEEQSDAEAWVSEVKGEEACGCTFIEPASNDYLGVVLRGQGLGTNESTNIRVSWYNFGTSYTDVDAGTDPDQPSTWVAGDLDCECTATEINTDAGLGAIDTAGECGPESTSTTSKEVGYSEFGCGDYN